MDFNSYLQKAWNEHAHDAEAVASGFKEGISLLKESSEVSKLCHLIVHVFGEHLMQMQMGIAMLEEVENSPFNTPETRRTLFCAKNLLNFCDGSQIDPTDLSFAESVRLHAESAPIWLARQNSEQAANNFHLALQQADGVRMSATDPVNRVLAVTSNSLAISLQEKKELSEADAAFMLLAARTARKYWEIAGTWLQVERAEYRLSQCFLKLGDVLNSIKHANLCLTICETNKAGALEFFFAYEAVALVEKAMGQPLRSLPRMKEYFAALSEDDKDWCEKILKQIEG